MRKEMPLRPVLRLLGAILLLFGLSPAADARLKLTKPHDSGFAHVDGISMFYQVYGKGPPILLIHGGLADADVWRRQIATLSAHHLVVVADSRGQGRSTRDDKPITYHLMARDYLHLLDLLKLPKVSLVGWSDGGIIGLDIAIHHPERLTRMFIQAANATPDGAIANRKAIADGIVAPPLQHYASITEEIEALWANEPNFSAEQLGAIRVPTMIVLGDHDEAIRRDHTEMLAKVIPGAHLLLLPNVGHSAPLEDPVGYASEVLKFVDGGPEAVLPDLEQRADEAGEVLGEFHEGRATAPFLK
jgi:pimeloyl-ACP methyl ester carboxylesterase